MGFSLQLLKTRLNAEISLLVSENVSEKLRANIAAFEKVYDARVEKTFP